MMTGQILAGAEPLDAVKYQLLIMFLIAGGTGLGTLAAVIGDAYRLTDNRHRLRLTGSKPADELRGRSASGRSRSGGHPTLRAPSHGLLRDPIDLYYRTLRKTLRLLH